MNTELDLNTLLGLIFGVGFATFVTVAVNSYRRIKHGKITDDESLIKRLDNQLIKEQGLRDACEMEKDIESRKMQYWREQAWTYRLQLIGAGIPPNDINEPNFE